MCGKLFLNRKNNTLPVTKLKPCTTNETKNKDMTDTNKEKEFTELLLQHQHIIYKVCLMYAQDKEDIADLYQETVYNLWKSYATFENRSSFSTWLYRVALNTCISDLRRRKHHEYVPLQLADTVLSDNDPKAEMLNTLYSLIRRLNKLDRMYIVLWLDEKTYDEIAEIVGTNRNQVAIRLHRIKEKLKTMTNL